MGTVRLLPYAGHLSGSPEASSAPADPRAPVPRAPVAGPDGLFVGPWPQPQRGGDFGLKTENLECDYALSHPRATSNINPAMGPAHIAFWLQSTSPETARRQQHIQRMVHVARNAKRSAMQASHSPEEIDGVDAGVCWFSGEGGLGSLAWHGNVGSLPLACRPSHRHGWSGVPNAGHKCPADQSPHSSRCLDRQSPGRDGSNRRSTPRMGGWAGKGTRGRENQALYSLCICVCVGVCGGGSLSSLALSSSC
jgi:hypothetical protein